LEYARTAESAEDEAQALGGLGDAEYSRGRFLSAYRYFDECIEMSRERGFGRIVAANISMRGNSLQFKNELEQAWLDCREALELAVKVRQPRAEMMSRSVASYLLLEMAAYDQNGRSYACPDC
jgi:tetratricopeptide (TPR) repeat protein